MGALLRWFLMPWVLLAVVVLLAEDAEHVLVIVGEHNILEVAPNL